jgi:hypothetical protein
LTSHANVKQISGDGLHNSTDELAASFFISMHDTIVQLVKDADDR